MSLPKECPVGLQRKRRKTPGKNLEAGVVRDCLRFLRECPGVIYVERRNTGALQIQGGGYVRFGSKGAADIWCLVKTQCRHPLHIEIECKRADGKGRLSPNQKTFQNFCGHYGIFYIVTTSAEYLAKIVGEIILDNLP